MVNADQAFVYCNNTAYIYIDHSFANYLSFSPFVQWLKYLHISQQYLWLVLKKKNVKMLIFKASRFYNITSFHYMLWQCQTTLSKYTFLSFNLYKILSLNVTFSLKQELMKSKKFSNCKFDLRWKSYIILLCHRL